MSMMEPVRDNNDLGHPLCDNLRSGDWLPGYTINRLKLKSSTKKIADILGVVFEHLIHSAKIPNPFLILMPLYQKFINI